MAEPGSSFMEPLLQSQQYETNRQLAPAELAQKIASTRYTSALADKVEMDTVAAKKAAAMMLQDSGGGAPSGAPPSISSMLFRQSQIWAQAGNPVEAARLASQASQAQAHEATARAADIRGRLSQMHMAKEQYDQFSKILENVDSPEGWDSANALIEKQFGKSPFSDMPYDPDLIRTIREGAMTAYQKQTLDLRGRALQADLQNKASEIHSRATRDGIAEEHQRVYAQREARLAKAAGKDVGSPGKGELEAARNLVGDSLPEGDAKDAAAYHVASEARVIRRKNPAVSSDEAMRQALAKAKANGDFVPGKKSYIPFTADAPSKFTTPTALPKTKAQLVAGQHYTLPGGKVGEWTGKDWKQVGTGATEGGASPEDDDEEDDADE